MTSFKNENDVFHMQGWAADCIITCFTVFTGQIIERTYYYLDSINGLNEPGIYDLIVSYKDELIEVKDFLTIK